MVELKVKVPSQHTLQLCCSLITTLELHDVSLNAKCSWSSLPTSTSSKPRTWNHHTDTTECVVDNHHMLYNEEVMRLNLQDQLSWSFAPTRSPLYWAITCFVMTATWGNPTVVQTNLFALLISSLNSRTQCFPQHVLQQRSTSLLRGNI